MQEILFKGGNHKLNISIIEIDYHLVRYHLSDNILHLILVNSSDQTTNISMKTIPSSRFHDLISKLKMVSVEPP